MSLLTSLSRAFRNESATKSKVETSTSRAVSSEKAVIPIPAESHSQQVFLARQPIFDRDLNLFGYELLYRDGHVDKANVSDDNVATAHLFTSALVEIGLTDLVGDRKAFVNLGPEMTFEEFPFTEYKDRLVLEILESIKIDASLLNAIKRMKEQGYTVALDDVVVNPEIELLLPFVDIVKLDLPLIPPSQLAQQIRMIREQSSAAILVEKIETPEVFRQCFDLGCDYFQGYFFAKPSIISSNRVPESSLTVLQLISELQNPNVSVTEIERLIKYDASLSYKLLRYINSAMTGVSQKITSVRQAVTLLGLNRIRVVATLLGLAAQSNKPHELLITALVRARTCEVIAQRQRMQDPQSGFVVGLFSLLDAMFDQSLDELIAKLPLAENITDAILRREGELGEILQAVCCFERGDWTSLESSTLNAASMRQSYLEAIRWTSVLQPSLFFEKSN
ncbi:HDOD domain-containing protein [bacterium]|nr:HDOD domain-containing protein [bacterium]